MDTEAINAIVQAGQSSMHKNPVVGPDGIVILSPIFLERPNTTIGAKLRYRVEKGEPLRFKIDILNRKVIEYGAFRSICSQVESATGRMVLLAR
jgi:hypothetical protein